MYTSTVFIIYLFIQEGLNGFYWLANFRPKKEWLANFKGRTFIPGSYFNRSKIYWLAIFIINYLLITDFRAENLQITYFTSTHWNPHSGRHNDELHSRWTGTIHDFKQGIRTISPPDEIPSAHFCIGGHNPFRVFLQRGYNPPCSFLQGGQKPFCEFSN